MKRLLTLAVAMLAVCGASCAGYFLGYHRGFDRALILQNGTFVGTFDALQKLRSGDVAAGTRRIETLCFMSANSVYSGRPTSQFVAQTFLKDFRIYRHLYRSNTAEWSVAEQNLETKLASWK